MFVYFLRGCWGLDEVRPAVAFAAQCQTFIPATAQKGKYVFYIWWKLKKFSLAAGAWSPDLVLKQNMIYNTPAPFLLSLSWWEKGGL